MERKSLLFLLALILISAIASAQSKIVVFEEKFLVLVDFKNCVADVAKLREDGARGAELAEKTGKLRLEAGEKVLKVLNDDQKKAWQKLQGASFDVSKLSR